MHPNLDPEFALELLAGPNRNDNKYSRGVVGFVTGSQHYPGAALLGLAASYELEVGMACYLGPKYVTDLVLSNRPETILGIERAKALVVGSGVADSETGEQRQNILEASTLGLPMVVDAGALQILDPDSLKAPAVLTPHAGEAERLFEKLGHQRHRKDIEANPTGSAWELAELTGKVVLLKGSISVLALRGEQPIESGPGSIHLATAGTGDVLAGMIGALAAKFVGDSTEITPLVLRDIALLANQLHSEAAELAAKKGRFGASAVCESISEAANPS